MAAQLSPLKIRRRLGGLLHPSGTVTFLFTDIEGSTRLWERHPQEMRRALARHDALLREKIESRGGYVFKTVGDAFCAAFDSPLEALAAALAIQHALLSEEWGETPIRVRMALHTGQADERDGDYFGPDVNRIARLLSAGHGGQVLLSEAAEQLIHGKAAQNVELRSLGSHRLKDLGLPERVYQAYEPGLRFDFPALNSLNSHPNNLPVQKTSFIGREAQVTAVAAELAKNGARLVTLTGPGGTGKTRLSLQVAAENLAAYEDGVFFVALAPLSDPEYVVSTITQALGVRSTGQRPQVERLKEYLAGRQMLLVLDNFEHVTQAAPLVSDLLSASAGLHVLVTSRIPLQLYGERVYRVPPFGLPGSDSLASVDRLAENEAVQLFVERAAAAKQGFALSEKNAVAVAQICSKLDGLPLAIELAAARIRMYSPELILERLQNRMQFLSRAFKDLPERQQTLRAAIAWSENLLSQADQILFRRLAVFAGGATFEAAEAVCHTTGDLQHDLDVWRGLENLLDHSLLQLSEDDDEPHFYMLETIRDYAVERLVESGEAEPIRRRHADYFLALAETAEPELWQKEQAAWLARLEREHDNFRTALSWFFSRAIFQGLRLSAALGRFWHFHGHYSEGREWLKKFLAATGDEDRSQAVYAKAANRAGMLAWYHGDYAEALELQEQAVRLWQEIGEDDGLAYALKDYAMAIWVSGDLPRARAIVEQSVSLFRTVSDDPGLVDALFWQSWFAMLAGDLDQARSIAEEDLALARSTAGATGTAAATSILGHVAYQQGDVDSAKSFYETSLHYFREAGDLFGIIVLLGSLADVSYLNSDHRLAQIYLQERLQITRTMGHRTLEIDTLNRLSLVSALLEQVAETLAYLGESLRACLTLEEPREEATAESLIYLALLLAKEKKLGPAARLFGAAEGLSGETVLDPVGQGIYEMGLSEAQAQLQNDAFEPQRAEGRVMGIEEAVGYALQLVSEMG